MAKKKEYIVLFVIIALIAFYLGFKDNGRENYELPKLDDLNLSKITKLTVKKDSDIIEIEKGSDNIWYILPEKFPADREKVNKVIEAVYKVRITALVSETESYARYELDEATKLSITLYDGDKKLRNLNIGKVASSYQHTFVKLENNKNVYHAKNDIRSAADKSKSDLRDKKVLIFKSDDVNSLTISTMGNDHEYNKISYEDENKKEQMKWIGTDQKDANPKIINTFLKSLSALECETFLDDSEKDNFGEAEITITLSTDKEYKLTLYPKDKDGKIPALSTDSPYAFTLSTWKFEDELKTLADIKDVPEEE